MAHAPQRHTTVDDFEAAVSRLRELLATIPDPTGLRRDCVVTALRVNIEGIEAAEFDFMAKHFED